MKIFAALMSLLIAMELGAIWVELRGIRHEQVKNALQAMPRNVLGSRDGVVIKRLESMISLYQTSPVRVQIDNILPLQVEVENISPVPVEIQR